MSNATPEIIVSRGPSGYLANFYGANDAIADEIKRLFGTYVLPLPWGPNAHAETVRADVAGRYPQHRVRLAPGL